jgi:hypothetical protein
MYCPTFHFGCIHSEHLPDPLVSSTLRDLVIGSGLQFEEGGSYELKDVPGEWRLFAVASSEGASLKRLFCNATRRSLST